MSFPSRSYALAPTPHEQLVAAARLAVLALEKTAAERLSTTVNGPGLTAGLCSTERLIYALLKPAMEAIEEAEIVEELHLLDVETTKARSILEHEEFLESLISHGLA